MRKPAKPIRIFFSVLSRRFYATRSYQEIKPGLMVCTGEKFDVTNEIAGLIEEHGLEFKVKPAAEV